MIELRRTAGKDATTEKFSTGEGSRLMGEIRRLIREQEGSERALLEKTAEREADSA